MGKVRRINDAEGSKKTLTIVIVAVIVLLTAAAGYFFWQASQQVEGSGQVTITDSSFAPETIQIEAGQTVTWTNQDTTPHTVRGEAFDDASVTPGFDSGELNQGDSFTYQFEKAGSYNYYDERNSIPMQGRVEVQ